MNKRLPTSRLLACLLTALAPLLVGGQTLPTSHLISGLVLDQNGAVIAGARVTLRRTGEQLGVATTDEAGAFRFARVAVGDYTVTIEAAGFATTAATVTVGARPPSALRIVLAVAGVAEEMIVGQDKAQPSINQDDNLTAIRIDRATLDNLPTLNGDPFAALATFLDPAAAATGGASLVVDGMETRELGVTASAIKEIKINQNPYSAEFFRQGLNRFEIVTRAGGPEYHGTFNLYLRDYRLEARNALARVRPPERRRVYEGFLSGPLGDGQKTSFLLSVSRREEDLQSIVFARTLAGAVTQNVANPQRRLDIAFRINHEVGRRHTVSVRYEFLDDKIAGAGVGQFELPEVAVTRTNREHHFYYNQQSRFTPNLINDLTIRTGTHGAYVRSLRPDVPRLVVLDSFTGGGAQADRYDTENHVQVNDIMTWARGRHVIKTGLNLPDISRRGSTDRSNQLGTYLFASLADYAVQRPFAYRGQRGEEKLVFWQLEFGTFLQDELRVRPNLSLFAGLRYNWQNYLGDVNNFAPRLAFAFAPGQQSRTVIRGGAGVFHDRTANRPIENMLRFDGARLRQYVIANPTFPFITDPAQLAALPVSSIRFAPDIKAPYTMQHSLSLERQLAGRTALTVTYTGLRGINLFLSRDINAPLTPRAARPDITAGLIRQIESVGYQRTHALEFQLRGRLTRFFDGLAQYTLAKTDNNTGGIDWLPANQYDLRLEYGAGDFDERQRFNLAGTFKATAWLNLGAIFTFSSGRPYSLTTGTDDNGDTFATDRPAGVRRNTLRLPAQAALDLRWSREFYLQKRKRDKGASLTFGVDGFNVFNRVNYTAYVGNQRSPLFGQPVAARAARRVQFNLRFKF